MKKLIVFALVTLSTQTLLARIGADQVAEDNKRIFGTPNSLFVQKACKAQLEELLILEKKHAYMDGIETILRQYLGRSEIAATAVEQATTHVGDLETFRLMVSSEKSYKKDLFEANCHTQANPIRKKAE